MLRYIEVPETVETEIRKFVVMRSNPESLVGEVSAAYDALLDKIVEIVENKAYEKWLDEDLPGAINPIVLRASAVQLAGDTIEVYANKIENETARKMLMAIFETDELEAEEEGDN